jgi:hypothetical protein
MKNFPTRPPVGMLVGAVLGFFSVVPIFAIWRHYQPPLERFYLSQYAGTTLAQTPVGTVLSFFHSRRHTRIYFVLMQDGRPVTARRSQDPERPISVRLVETTPRIFGLWLQNQIYARRAFPDLLRTPVGIWVGTVLSLFGFGVSYDFVRRKRAREGVPLRGPNLMTRRDFNRATKGDGFTLHVRS